MKSAWTCLGLLLVCVAPASRADDVLKPNSTVAELIESAEKFFYAVELPDHLAQADRVLDQIEKLNPKEVYVYWGRARTSFFRKELFYSEKPTSNAEELVEQKLQLADRCHKSSDTCLALAPTNPECHLLKGSCYAMQASTWGVGFKAMRVCKPMDDEWAKAMELPSNFIHQAGVQTRQLAQTLRGILARAMPDSWWFRVLAGIRGNKQRAYQWIKEGAKGPMLKEPMILMELAATAICVGQKTNDPNRIQEGLSAIEDALRLPIRFSMDEFDRKNLLYLKGNVQEACNYRRERFENLSEEAISSKIDTSRK